MQEFFFQDDTECGKLADLLAVGPLSFDTETIGWRPKKGNRPADPLVGPTAPQAVCATLAGEDFTCWVRIWGRPELARAVREALAKPGRAIIGHNLGFDAHAAKSFEASIGGVWYDTATLSIVENTARFSHGLKDLTKELLGRDEVVSFQEMCRRVFGVLHTKPDKHGKSRPLASNRAVEGDLSSEHCLQHPEFRAYAMADARNTYDVWVELKRRLQARGKWRTYLSTKREQDRMAWESEVEGVYVDRDQLETSAVLARAERDRLAAILEGAAPGTNWNSPAQVVKALGAMLGQEWYGSTDVKALTKLRDEDLDPEHPAHEQVDALINYRAVSKQCSAFFDCLPTRLVGNYLHPSIKVHGTDTGRDSCSNPNLYQVSGRKDRFGLRKAFAASPGRLLVVADYSAIEWLLAMFFSQDSAMLDVQAKGWCPHAYTAMMVFPDVKAFVDEKLAAGLDMKAALKAVKEGCGTRRDAAKTTNYSELYGIWVKSLRGRLLLEGIRLDDDTVKTMLLGWQATYRGFMRYMADLESHLGFAMLDPDPRARRYIETLAGRQRHIDAYAWGSQFGRGGEIRSLKNALIQGSAADLLDKASALCREDEELRAWGYKLRLRVYDELFGDAPEETAAQCADRVKHHMRAAGDFFGVLPRVDVSGGIGKTWKDAK